MNVAAKVLSPSEYYEEAKKMLEKKEFVGFVSNISKSELLASNDKDMLAKTLFLKVKGLFNFRHHKDALECISEAVEYNTGEEVLRLKNYESVIYGYLGDLEKAKKTFKELISETQEIEFMVEVYLNLVWVYLTLDKNHTEHNIEAAKQYLDIVYTHFEVLPKELKWKISNNYSVYYYYKENYDKAIQILEDSIQYCEEQYLPDVYNNLAEIYLKIAKIEGSIMPDVVKDYLDKAEVLGSRYSKNISLGYTFYFKAEAELMEDQLFKALDTLCLAFDYFKDAEATVMACDCLVRINEIMDEYKHNSLESLRENLKKKLKDTPYSDQI